MVDAAEIVWVMETSPINWLHQTLLIPLSVKTRIVLRDHLAKIIDSDETGWKAMGHRYGGTYDDGVQVGGVVRPRTTAFYVCRRGRPPLRPFSRAA